MNGGATGQPGQQNPYMPSLPSYQGGAMSGAGRFLTGPSQMAPSQFKPQTYQAPQLGSLQGLLGQFQSQRQTPGPTGLLDMNGGVGNDGTNGGNGIGGPAQGGVSGGPGEGDSTSGSDGGGGGGGSK